MAVYLFFQISSRVAHDQWNSLVNTLVTSVIADQNQADSLKDSELNDLARRLTAVRLYVLSDVWKQLAFLTGDIFASFGVLLFSPLRANKLQDAMFYTCSYLYTGKFIILTVKSRYIVSIV